MELKLYKYFFLLQAFIFIFGVAFSYTLFSREQEQVKEELIRYTEALALGIPAEDILSLSGQPEDIYNPSYQNLKKVLQRGINIAKDARFVYLFGQRPDGRIFFFVDSEAESSEDYSPPGQNYDQATVYDTQIFKDGISRAFSARDEWGRWFSVGVPVFEPYSGRVAATLNIDIPESVYYFRLLNAAAPPFLTSILLILALFVYKKISQGQELLVNQRAQYLSIAAHDLKAPLTGIRWLVEGMLKPTRLPPSKKIKDNLKSISEGSSNMLASIEDLLNASKSQVGKIISNRWENVNLSEISQKLLSNLHVLVEQKELKIKTSLPSALLTRGDTDSMRRALGNLVSNAIKYSKNGGTVTIIGSKENQNLKWEIFDEGIGIPEGEKAKVLTGYYRASNAKNLNIPGTGLGLYYAKKVIEAHGGNLKLHSRTQKGTQVIVVLPINQP